MTGARARAQGHERVGVGRVRLASTPDVWADPLLTGAEVTVFPSTRAAEAVWRAAAASGTCSIFQTYEWLSTWRETIGAVEPITDHIVHVATPSGRTLMLLPLAVRRNPYGRSLEFLGGTLTDYNMPIVGADFAPGPGDAGRLWAAILDLLPRVDIVRLQRMPLAFDGVANPLAGLPGVKYVIDAYGAALPATFKAFTVRSPSFFTKNRQHRRRLDKEGAVRVGVPRKPEERTALTRFVIEQKSLWQLASDRPNTFGAPDWPAFYEGLANRAFQEGSIEPVGLWVGSELVAGIWGAVFRGRFAVIVTAYRRDWGKFSVARVLMAETVEMCIGREDVEVFDLTVGDEGYKSNWSDHSLPLHEILTPRSLRGRMFLVYWNLRTRAKTVPWLRRAALAGARLVRRVPKRD